ncbi:hypothetical protein MTP99_007405 [Tenebrio molitor]|nr:hypothetical protein MTP99_007405 [Tenebrio molitor]
MYLKVLALFLVATSFCLCDFPASQIFYSPPSLSDMDSDPKFENDNSFDVYLEYPENTANITNMYLSCEWMEIEDNMVDEKRAML